MYLAKFELVLRYIERHLDEELMTEELSVLAGLSKFHFHRLFSAYAGMSVFALVKLLRFKRAAYQLAFRQDMKIIDVALMAGYESAAAFSRGFKNIFTQSPRDFRRQPNWGPWQKAYQDALTLRSNKMHLGENVQVELIHFPATKIAAFQHRGAPSLLGNSIAQFIRWRKENALPPSKSKTFNLIYDDPNVTAPDDFRFDIACAIKADVLDNRYGVINKMIPAGQCAKIRHIGSDDALAPIIQFLYTQWLSESGAELRDFPLFLERVTFYPDVSEAETITDIYLAIK